MAFTIRANNIDYIVSDHAAQRMVQRFISESLIAATIEQGARTEQEHGTVLYEHEVFDEDLEAHIVVRVVVEEAARIIVTVIDDVGDG